MLLSVVGLSLVLQQLLVLVLREWPPSLLLCAGVEALLLLPLLPKVEGVVRVLLALLLLHRLRLLLLASGVLAADVGLERAAVECGFMGCGGCLVGCLLPLVMTLNTGPLPDVDFHLLLLLLLPDSAGDGFALMLRTGVHAR